MKYPSERKTITLPHPVCDANRGNRTVCWRFLVEMSHGNNSRMATITGFHHAALHAADFDTSFRFYTEILGLKPKITWGEAPNRAVMLDPGDSSYLEIFEKSVPASTESGAILHFALRTDDCSGMLERVRTAGMKVTMETKDVTIGANIGPVPVRIAFFRGPDGEVVELFENTIL